MQKDCSIVQTQVKKAFAAQPYISTPRKEKCKQIEKDLKQYLHFRKIGV